MILFVFEGAKREPTLFKTMEYLFLSNNNQHRIYSYKNNIYNLYKQMTQTEVPEDIITILKKKSDAENDNELKDLQRRTDVSQIYLFFDYDRHNDIEQKIPDEDIKRMLDFFNDETSDFGKLYINYPMVESIYYSKSKLPDYNYYKYVSGVNLGRSFKEKVNQDSVYKNLDFIAFKINRKRLKIKIPKEKKIEEIKRNWLYLVEMNVKKANYICSGALAYPAKKIDIDSKVIFENQLSKYVNKNNVVSILNAFPLFLYEYKKC